MPKRVTAVPRDLRRRVPWLVRDGTGGNEWLPASHPQPSQVVPFEVIPFPEMPRIVDPPAGFVINANNDPDVFTYGNDLLARRRPGGGVLYLSSGYDAGFRAGRITRRVREVLARGGCASRTCRPSRRT